MWAYVKMKVVNYRQYIYIDTSSRSNDDTGVLAGLSLKSTPEDESSSVKLEVVLVKVRSLLRTGTALGGLEDVDVAMSSSVAVGAGWSLEWHSKNVSKVPVQSHAVHFPFIESRRF